MTGRCSVGLCTTNYDSQQERKGKRKRKKEVKKAKLKVFGFPTDRERCQRWLDALPNKIKFDDIAYTEDGTLSITLAAKLCYIQT